MKQIIFTLLLITTIGLISCRKTRNDPAIKEYDQIQIQNYINANGLTSMKRDSADGDTTGIYYQILAQGSTAGPALDYPDSISLVYTLKSFDGKYNSTDTINGNHIDNLLGHLTNTNSPIARGLQQAIHDVVKHRGTRARILIPSRMAFGVNGFGFGSSSNINTRIGGNQCLDYYVNVVSNLDAYDDYLINDYAKRHGIALSGYTHVTSGRGRGLYYKVNTPGTGTGDVIDDVSSFQVNSYTGKLLNEFVFDPGPVAGTPASFSSQAVAVGFAEAVKGQTIGANISMFIPSRLGYGQAGSPPDPTTGAVVIQPGACLIFDNVSIGTVSTP
jgi:FKBP-type peptidyl-prolyl cis-trans isomerase FkpA